LKGTSPLIHVDDITEDMHNMSVVLLFIFGFGLGVLLALSYRALRERVRHHAVGGEAAAEPMPQPFVEPVEMRLPTSITSSNSMLTSVRTVTQTALPSTWPTRSPTRFRALPKQATVVADKTADSVFLSRAVEAIQDSSDIVLFSGRTTKKLLDRPLPKQEAMVSLNGKVPTRTWIDIVRLVNKTYILNNNNNDNNNKAVHVHNEHKIGDLLEHLINDFRRTRKNVQLPPTRGEMHSLLDLGQAPIVLTNSADENWGFLSTGIGTRTTRWLNMTNHLMIHGVTYDTVHDFLDSHKIVLLVCNTHVDPMIGAHPKIISLPLGISRKGMVLSKAIAILKSGVKKKTLLQINNSGWGDRAFINRIVSEAFNGTVQNTYRGANTDEGKAARDAERRRKKRGGRRRLEEQHFGEEAAPLFDHFRETAEAKFVLCPSGLGYDTYRLWETLLLGSIPIVESNAGFDRTYSNLPVLVVRNYSDVTPQLLDRAYPCFVKNARLFQYSHLTLTYWINLIAKAVQTGSISHVHEQHPPKNKYCNFL
jgi:hypothetical protein